MKPESRELLEKFNKELSCFNCTHCDRNQKLEIFNPPAMFLEPKEYIGVTTPPVVFILSYPKKIDEDNKRIFSTPDKTRFKSWLVKAKLTNVYITNAVKCPTDDNQEPTKRQILKCASLYLMKELAVISPRVVVTVGKKALQAGFHNYTSEMLDNMVLKRHHTGAFAVYPIPHPFSFENSPDEELEQKVIEFLSNAFKENNEYPSIE